MSRGEEATRRESLRFRLSWIALLIVAIATSVFGLAVILIPSSDEQYLRAIGVASIGMGSFGAMIAMTAFRRRERWAFFSLCYWPIFWTAHLVGNLPPGKDHIHQVLFIALSLLGLLLAFDEFFGR